MRMTRRPKEQYTTLFDCARDFRIPDAPCRLGKVSSLKMRKSQKSASEEEKNERSAGEKRGKRKKPAWTRRTWTSSVRPIRISNNGQPAR